MLIPIKLGNPCAEFLSNRSDIRLATALDAWEVVAEEGDMMTIGDESWEWSMNEWWSSFVVVRKRETGRYGYSASYVLENDKKIRKKRENRSAYERRTYDVQCNKKENDGWAIVPVSTVNQYLVHKEITCFIQSHLHLYRCRYSLTWSTVNG